MPFLASPPWSWPETEGAARWGDDETSTDKFDPDHILLIVRLMSTQRFFSRYSKKRRFGAARRADQVQVQIQPEFLENRALLAGDVTTQLIGQNAFVNGDAAGNAIEITVINGDIVVRGLDGTTVNGSTDDFVLVANTSAIPGSLRVVLGGGNDTASVDGVTVRGDVFVSGGIGNDVLTLESSSVVGQNLNISGGRGADTIVLSSVNIGGRVDLSGGTGSDDIVVDQSQIGSRTRINGSRGHDDIVIRQSNLANDLRIMGRRGNDVIMLDASTVSGRTVIHAGGGADNIVIQGEGQFSGRVRAIGGAGRDRMQTSAETFFGRFRRRSFRGSTVSDALIASRITDAETGALGRAGIAVDDRNSELTLSVSESSVSEGADRGASVLTVARSSGSTDQELTVTLTSSNSSKLRPARTTVTIPEGQESVEVDLIPQDDERNDDDVTVTITATAANIASARIDVTVTNDDGDGLIVTPSQETVNEDTGNASTVGTSNSFTYTIFRNGDTEDDLVVDLSTSVSGHIEIQDQVTIPAGQSSVTVTARTIPDRTEESDVTVVLTASASGFESGTGEITVRDTDTARLIVDIGNFVIDETGSGSSVTATIRRPTDTTNALTVTVTSDNPDSVTIDGRTSRQVTIPAGSDSVDVILRGVEESLDDDDATVTITASASGFTDGSDTIVAQDNDTAALTITASRQTVEEDTGDDSTAGNANTITFTIFRNGDTTDDLDVDLSTSVSSHIELQDQVTILAGQSSVTVTARTVPDRTAESDVEVLVTASASGFVSDTESITVLDTDSPRLVVSIGDATIDESGSGSSVAATIRRPADTTGALTVTVTSDDPGNVTIDGEASRQVTIPAGSDSVTVTLRGIDENDDDDNATVTVTASASGFTDGTDTIVAQDDDVAALTVTASQESIEEDTGDSSTTGTANSFTYTISRNSDTSEDLVVNLSSSLVSDQIDVPSQVTIPAGQSSVTVTARTRPDLTEESDMTVVLTASASGFVSGSDSILMLDTDSDRLTVDINSSTIDESGSNSSVTATIRRPAKTTGAISVTVTSDDPQSVTIDGEASRQVTIPADRDSVDVTLRGVDEDDDDAGTTVTITASASGVRDGTDTIVAQDDDAATLTVTVSQDFIEEDTGTASSIGAANTFTYTITRSGDTSESLIVNLSASVTDQIDIPSQVTIPAGQSSTTVTARTVPDLQAESDLSVVLTASASGFVSDTESITILDTDSARLLLDIEPTTIDETGSGSSVIATIRRPENTTGAISVTVTSSDPANVTIDGQTSRMVTIPAGSDSVNVTLRGVDEDDDDGNTTVTITATASGFADGTDTIVAQDDDAATLTIEADLDTVPEDTGNESEIGTANTVTYTISRNGDTSENLVVNLSTSVSNQIDIPSQVTIPAGQSSTTVTARTRPDLINESDMTLTLTASAEGFVSGTDSITVLDTDSPRLSIELGAPTIDETGGGSSVTATIRRPSNTTQAVTVTITSNDPESVTIDGQTSRQVTIPAGRDSVDVTLRGVEEARDDADVTVTITAAASGFTNATGTIVAQDDDAAALTVTASRDRVDEDTGSASSIGEANSFIYTISRNGDTSEDLVVDLSASVSDQLDIPDQVTIPAGQSSTTVTARTVPDLSAESDMEVTLTASASGFVSGTEAITILDTDSPRLTVDIERSTITETGGSSSTTATIHRPAGTSDALTVTVTSNDPDNVTIDGKASRELTIPAGSDSVTVTLRGVDETLDDGDVTVTVTATASGLADGTGTILAQDDDVPTLTVVASQDTIEEDTGNGSEIGNANSLTYTIRRNGDTSEDLVVNLSSSLVSDQIDIPDQVTIPAGQSSVTVTAQTRPDVTEESDVTVVLTASASGFAPGTGSITVLDTDSPRLIVDIGDVSIDETGDDSTVTAIIRRPGDTAEALTVTVTSDDPESVTIDGATSRQVTIPAGRDSVDVTLRGVDEDEDDDDAMVRITATAADFTRGTGTIVAVDDDAAALSVTVSQDTIEEDTGDASSTGTANSFTYTISRSGDTSEDLIVELAVSVSEQIEIVDQVTIPAGQSSTTVTARTVPDIRTESDVDVVLTASASGFESGTDTITVLDTDSPRLTIDINRSTITEVGSNSAVTATIRRPTNTTGALTVTVTSDHPDSVTIDGEASRQVTIPAGRASVNVTLRGVNESLDDDSITVAVTVSASGFTDGSDSIVALDNDTPALSVTTSQNIIDEDDETGTVTVTVSRNSVDTSEALTADLSVTGDDRLSGPSSVTIPAGQESQTVTFTIVDNNIVDRSDQGLARITASTDDFASSTVTVRINDDDSSDFTVTPETITVQEDDGTNSSVVVSRTDSSEAETVSVSYSNPSIVTGPASITFAVGETQKTVELSIVDNDVFRENAAVTVTVRAEGQAGITARVEVENDDFLDLTTDITNNRGQQSNGAWVTDSSSFLVTGTTAPGATVQLETNGDSEFDDGFVTADSDGNFFIDVPLSHDENNRGLNTFQVRAVLSGVEATDTETITVHRAIGTVVRIQTNQDFDNDGEKDFFDIELLDDAAPETVENFLNYTTSTAIGTERFDDLLVQRSVDNFVIQAGRFNADGTGVTEVDRDADNDGQPDTIENEFDSANSNLRGTLSMALPAGQPNGGSSEWFINVTDNTSLDDASRLHTVFGRVIGDGMNVVDAINSLSTFDLNPQYNAGALSESQPDSQGALGEVPLLDSPQRSLSGTVSVTASSTEVNGSGTRFLSEVEVGDFINIDGTPRRVSSILSDTRLSLDSEVTSSRSGLSISVVDVDDTDYVVFTDIGVILDSV